MRITWLLVCFGIARASAATLSLPSLADTSIYEDKADSNLGGTTLLAGTNHRSSKARGMLKFDVSALPVGAMVTAVQVQLYVTRQPDPDQHGGPAASDFSLHRMLVSWGEGTGSAATGSVSMAGDATWNERHFQAISWGNPGGLAGTDFLENASATTSVGDVGPYVWGSSPELVADVRAWVADPAANFGLMLMSGNEGTNGSARRFSSRNQPGGAILGPQLVITYTMVPEPSAAGMFALAAGLFLLGKRRR
ncbi:MAG: DNRLRE domain-containing protein [Verrucomicrobiota bacterium]